jgi:hypothetical protein
MEYCTRGAGQTQRDAATRGPRRPGADALCAQFCLAAVALLLGHTSTYFLGFYAVAVRVLTGPPPPSSLVKQLTGRTVDWLKS